MFRSQRFHRLSGYLRASAMHMLVARRGNENLQKTLSKLALSVAMASMLATGVGPRPAVAQSQGTINTLLGAAAVIGGLILYNNYQHKKQAANSIVGYPANGGAGYGDGRVGGPTG